MCLLVCFLVCSCIGDICGSNIVTHFIPASEIDSKPVLQINFSEYIYIYILCFCVNFFLQLLSLLIFWLSWALIENHVLGLLCSSYFLLLQRPIRFDEQTRKSLSQYGGLYKVLLLSYPLFCFLSFPLSLIHSISPDLCIFLFPFLFLSPSLLFHFLSFSLYLPPFSIHLSSF